MFSTSVVYICQYTPCTCLGFAYRYHDSDGVTSLIYILHQPWVYLEEAPSPNRAEVHMVT